MADIKSAVAEATARLAEFVAVTQYEDIPVAVRERAKLVVADTLGVTLLASQEPEMQRLYSRLPAGKGAVLFRPGFPQADPATAAFANATATCFLELDEGIRPTAHPALHTLPVALALAQSLRRSGAEYLTAMILGYEVISRIQWACRLRKPVHPHGNLGHPAAVASVGKLSRWSAEEIRQGMNMSASLASGTSFMACLAGATVRNSFPGVTAQVAFTVKMLVESGFTGYDEALGETFGEILAEDFNPEVLTRGLGERWYLLEGYSKFHAACAQIHTVLDAVAEAVGAALHRGSYPPMPAPVRPRPEEIREVRVRIAERSLRLAVQARPNQLSAKFSFQYGVAAYLVRGNSGPESFKAEAIADRRVWDLATRVVVSGDPALSARWPEEAASEVEIELEDGRLLRGSCINPFGTPSNPATAEDLLAKFRYLTSGVLAESEQQRFWRACLGLETQADMSEFPF